MVKDKTSRVTLKMIHARFCVSVTVDTKTPPDLMIFDFRKIGLENDGSICIDFIFKLQKNV